MLEIQYIFHSHGRLRMEFSGNDEQFIDMNNCTAISGMAALTYDYIVTLVMYRDI